jgi:hypothetical protein
VHAYDPTVLIAQSHFIEFQRLLGRGPKSCQGSESRHKRDEVSHRWQPVLLGVRGAFTPWNPIRCVGSAFACTDRRSSWHDASALHPPLQHPSDRVSPLPLCCTAAQLHVSCRPRAQPLVGASLSLPHPAWSSPQPVRAANSVRFRRSGAVGVQGNARVCIHLQQKGQWVVFGFGAGSAKFSQRAERARTHARAQARTAQKCGTPNACPFNIRRLAHCERPRLHAGSGSTEHIGSKVPLPGPILLKDGVYEVGRP